MSKSTMYTGFPYKIGDKVRNKYCPEEYGEVCCISYTQRTVRFILQNPLGKVWWYDVEELELI